VNNDSISGIIIAAIVSISITVTMISIADIDKVKIMHANCLKFSPNKEQCK